MPIYEYQCSNCHKKFELRQNFTDDSIVTCPNCDAVACRLFSPVPIVFKGSGFYITDSRNKDPKKKGTAVSDR